MTSLEMTFRTTDTSRNRHALKDFADTALKAAAGLWFLVAIIGQLIFVCYVVSFYGGAAVRGDLQAWNRFMTHGYVPGDTMGNFAVAMHFFLAVIIIAGGAIQFVPQIRDRAPSFHRWNGRIYILTAFTLSIVSLYMIWMRLSVGDIIQHVGTSLNAVLIMLCAAFTVRYALARKFDVHRRWALRLFMVVSGVWFFRVGLMLWVFLNYGSAGLDPKRFQDLATEMEFARDSGSFLTFLSFAQYLAPLAILEIYLRARHGTGAPGRIAMAAGLFVLTVAMSVGIFAASMGMWLPHI